MSDPYIVTDHDTIPNFAYAPTIVSVQDGAWEDAATWDLARVPEPADVVAVGHVITVLAADTAVIGVTGALRLLDGVSIAAAIIQSHGGRVESDGPISGEIVIKDQPLDLMADPDQFGTGLIAIDGAFRPQGLPKLPWLRLTAEPRAGDTVLPIITGGWQVGDALVIPDTREVRTGPSQIELPTIAAVDATSVTLAAPLQFDHLGARDLDGVLRYLPHVGNLTRSLVIRSENPLGTRGHVMATGHCDVDLRYVEFRGLGRTTEEQLDPIENHVGRYAFHGHHLHHAFNVEGCAVSDARKWGIAAHDSDFWTIQGNVVYHATGAGIATEDGTEKGGVIDGNFVVRCDGSESNPNNYQRSTSFLDDNGHEGSGFWFRAGGNQVTNNVAANCRWAGFNFFARYGNIGKVNQQPIALKEGSELTQTLDTRRLVPAYLADNEAYASGRGLETWYEFATPSKNFAAWHVNKAGMYLYYGAEAEVDGLTVLSQGTTEDGFLSEQGISLVGRNFDIQGCVEGFQTKSLKKSLLLSDSTLRNTTNFHIKTPDVPLAKPQQFVNVTLDGDTRTGIWNGSDVDNSGPYLHPWSITCDLEPEQIVSGTVTITVTRVGPQGDGKIEFYISGKNVKDDNTDPFNYVWDTTTWANGPHWVQIEWAGSSAYPGLRDWKSFRVFVDNP